MRQLFSSAVALLFSVFTASWSAAQPRGVVASQAAPLCDGAPCAVEFYDGPLDVPVAAPRVALTRLAVTSADPAELEAASALVDRLIGSGQLEAAAPVEPDLQVVGRTHQHFVQMHAGYVVRRGGVTIQRDTRTSTAVSVFGVLHLDTDALLAAVPAHTVPLVSSLRARRAAADFSGAAVAAPPRLLEAVIHHEPFSGYALVHPLDSADGNRYFVDALGGSVIGSEPAVFHQHGRPAIGTGEGILGYEKNLSTTETHRGYEARDIFRPGSVVTLDLGFNGNRSDALQDPDRRIMNWESDLAASFNNRWRDDAVVDAHAYAGFTYDWLYKHGWRGIDGRDGTAFQIVNAYPNDYANAYWWGPPAGPQKTGVLVYGQNDRVPYVSVDVVAHEYQHGVTHYGVSRRGGEGLWSGYTATTARTDVVQAYGSDGSLYRVRVPCGRTFVFPVDSDSWLYRRPVFYLCAEDRRLPLLVTREAGAANEALSDVIATAVEYSVHTPNQGNLRGDWQIGEDLDNVIRDLQNPSRLRFDRDNRAPHYPQRFPSVYSAVVRFVPLMVRTDNGKWYPLSSNIMSQDGGRSLSFGPSSLGYDGVHWNSTILSHAFYRAVAGGCHSVTQVCVSHSDAAQYSRDDVAGVFLRAVTRFIQPDSTLREVGQAIRQAARDLADPRGALIRGIDRALTGVGL